MAQSPFRRSAGDDVAEAAQRRLDLLRQELAQAGLTSPPPGDAPGVPDDREEPARPLPPTPTSVTRSGRHVRRRAPGAGSLLSGWLVDRLPATLQGRVTLGHAQSALVAVIAAVGLAVAAVLVLRSGSGGTAVVPASSPTRAGTTRPLVPVASVSAAPSALAGAATGPTTGQAGASPTGVVVVDVAGKVRRPGVVTLPAGSRVLDALRRAGGARRAVDLSVLNLARVLVDGEQILVGVQPAPGTAASAAATSTAGATAPGQLVNINTATLDGLEALPGVGPVTAQKILDWRTAHGAFSSVDELLEVDGIGEKTLADMAPYVTL